MTLPVLTLLADLSTISSSQTDLSLLSSLVEWNLPSIRVIHLGEEVALSSIRLEDPSSKLCPQDHGQVLASQDTYS